MDQLVNSGITILIALVAGLVALYQVKSNIVSASRITWIENLRDSISSYCVEVSSAGTLLANMNDSLKKCNKSSESDKVIAEFYPGYQEVSRKVAKLGYKVRLYLNANEVEHKKIEQLILKLDSHIHEKPFYEVDRKQIENDVEDIMNLSKKIFSLEWKKAKTIFKI